MTCIVGLKHGGVVYMGADSGCTHDPGAMLGRDYPPEDVYTSQSPEQMIEWLKAKV